MCVSQFNSCYFKTITYHVYANLTFKKIFFKFHASFAIYDLLYLKPSLKPSKSSDCDYKNNHVYTNCLLDRKKIKTYN